MSSYHILMFNNGTVNLRWYLFVSISFCFQVLCLYDAIEVIDVDMAVEYIKALQQTDGSFVGDKWGKRKKNLFCIWIKDFNNNAQIHFINKKTMVWSWSASEILCQKQILLKQTMGIFELPLLE